MSVSVTMHGFNVVIAGVRYVHKKGCLFYRREPAVGEDVKQFLNVCGEPVTELSVVNQFLEEMTRRNLKRNATRIANRLRSIEERNTSGIVDVVLNVVSKKHVKFQDLYESAIVSSAKELGVFRFCDIYFRVCVRLGATDEQAAKGVAPDPYRPDQLKDVRGLIRSWIEERSPHSRQHYFRGGKRVQWLPGERPLLFVNPGLAAENNEAAWRPYHTVRGTQWCYDPEAAAAAEKPAEDVLAAAEAMYRKKGMQGKRETMGETAVIYREPTLAAFGLGGSAHIIAA